MHNTVRTYYLPTRYAGLIHNSLETMEVVWIPESKYGAQENSGYIHTH